MAVSLIGTSGKVKFIRTVLFLAKKEPLTHLNIKIKVRFSFSLVPYFQENAEAYCNTAFSPSISGSQKTFSKISTLTQNIIHDRAQMHTALA